MRENRPIRLIRKSQPDTNGTSAAGTVAANRPEPSEREIKTVVTSWVSDHRRRSEEFRKTIASLWQAGELHFNTR
jgi:hypothetical protein